MKKLSKRVRQIRESVEQKPYPILEAIELLKKLSTAKFVESVDVSVNLGIDPTKSDQNVRSAVVLPHGTGKQVKVAVITQGANLDVAKKAGADEVGFEELAEKIKAENFDFDVLIASPDAMPLVGKLGTILGPRGLMPNPKVGTVSADIESAVKNAKAGQARFRADKAGIVHCRIGGVNFEQQQIKENLEVLITALKKAKPSSSKGVYLKKVTLSTTMGPGLMVDINSLDV
ncbi:MAG: 50S ribosomal protein L1 [Pseudomonadota bacterium]|nr:50S ribosomal protein L1 [Gammaproteobacteria bacterium]MBU1628926.1 50S ribosomal protein L1 [Gammaproteobacteria bacterium]MBU1926284.1 50S ribosomal protein L1 [Gammaproteobacteria bacterium]MBU2545920.1 50S ribosomal protein L1 [Gammaproteobacteria bacterium]